MTVAQRLGALFRRLLTTSAVTIDPSPATRPLVRSPLAPWSAEDLRILLETIGVGSKVGYFAYYPDQYMIDDFTGLYVTLTAEAGGTFRRMAGNHGRSDEPRFCTLGAALAEIESGRGRPDAFIDHAS